MLESIGLSAWVLIAMGHVLSCVVVYWDASNHCDYGWLWFICCVFCPPLVLVYIAFRVWGNRGPGARDALKRKLERAQHNDERTPSEVERLRYLALVEGGAGTLYEGPAQRHGFRHFMDERAEQLLAAGQQQAAFKYLSELYAEAQVDGDGIRQDTYMYYLNQLPGGPERLEEWLTLNQTAVQGGSKPPF
jgi:hypothetical protein